MESSVVSLRFLTKQPFSASLLENWCGPSGIVVLLFTETASSIFFGSGLGYSFEKWSRS
jgi:hypothetical protein